jgi:putative glycosyltransferase (TIGR04372 family)
MPLEQSSLTRFLNPRFLLDRIRDRGLKACVGIVFTRVLVEIIYRLGIRYLGFNYDVIGHLAAEPDLYLKDGLLGLRPNHFGVALIPSDKRVGNAHLLKYWQRHLYIIRSPYWCRVLGPILRNAKVDFNVHQYMATLGHAPDVLFSTARYPMLQQAWGDRPPLLKLTAEDQQRGRAALREMGVPDDAWFVTFHCREPGFHGQWDVNGLQAKFQDFRDADIRTYDLAIDEITARGGWCIRIGDPTMRPIRPRPQVIDYAHSPLKSEWLDIYLLASSKFLLGCLSGPNCVPNLFGVPTAAANHCPMSVLPLGGNDTCIPKMLRSVADGRLLSFEEVLGSRLGNLVNSTQYVEAGVEIVNNTPEEIAELALEMLDRVNGTAEYTEEDERRQADFKSSLRPGHYAYGARSRISRDFLRRHRNLLSQARPSPSSEERTVALHF